MKFLVTRSSKMREKNKLKIEGFKIPLEWKTMLIRNQHLIG